MGFRLKPVGGAHSNGSYTKKESLHLKEFKMESIFHGTPAERKQLLGARRFTDAEGFWTTTRVHPLAGGATNTYAHNVRPNGVYLLQRYYCPGPLHALAYGVEDRRSQAAAEYSVYTGVCNLDDEACRDSTSCRTLVLAKNPNADLSAMEAGAWSIWSPDGEGCLYLDFGDLLVEHAIRFADSLSPRIT